MCAEQSDSKPRRDAGVSRDTSLPELSQEDADSLKRAAAGSGTESVTYQ